MLGAVLLVGEGRLLGTGSVRVMLIGHWLGGCLTSIVWFIPQSMIADVCDEEELVSGERREGMFFGLFYLARQLAVGLTSLLAGVLLDWFAGLQPGAVAQSGRTVSRIGILFGVYPAIALALGGVLMLRYTLSARRVAAIRVELNNRRGLAACR
jgi:GPH family glycoside/pentoside/hexuronide:cation symporter